MVFSIHGEPRVLLNIKIVAGVGEVVNPQPDFVTLCKRYAVIGVVVRLTVFHCKPRRSIAMARSWKPARSLLNDLCSDLFRVLYIARGAIKTFDTQHSASLFINLAHHGQVAHRSIFVFYVGFGVVWIGSVLP